MLVNAPSGTPNMLLFLITVIVALWASRAHGQETTCDPPTIANGFYAPHRTKYRLEDEITYRCDNSFAPASRGNKTRCTDRGWRPSPRCILKPCEFPEIKHGDLYREDRYRPYFPASVGKRYFYTCDDNYVTPAESNWNHITCTPEGWSPKVPCIRKCVFSYLENGYYPSYEQNYLQGESVRVFCHPGYSLPHQQTTVTCTESGWAPPPRCVPVVTCLKSDLESENGFISESELVYPLHKETQYKCKQGYSTEDGQTSGIVTCLQRGWSTRPRCIKSAEKCGPPPVVSNGDITSFPLTAYPPWSRVEYRCQAYYELRGPKYVTCSFAKWSEPPRCLDPCVISEEILNENNIQLKGKEDKTYYAKTGDSLKFTCKSGHSAVTSRQSFQAVCQEGTVQLPRCE
ncbi:complement factor H-related protein 3 isoform X9 [Desmodus rotundus]|uniref:complement factor H-related protein 3 isoform X9 n=1 Tax=Desmodus rotundus TaxID=9430 RepID=UPI002381162B|nr:complement factor H-related protein 3 isoform X9 [Desmodus rotundus]